MVIDVSTKYGRLLQNQYEYILHHQDAIQAQAQKLYEKVNKSDSFFTKMSCDFKLLEDAVAKWIIAATKA